MESKPISPNTWSPCRWVRKMACKWEKPSRDFRKVICVPSAQSSMKSLPRTLTTCDELRCLGVGRAAPQPSMVISNCSMLICVFRFSEAEREEIAVLTVLFILALSENAGSRILLAICLVWCKNFDELVGKQCVKLSAVLLFEVCDGFFFRLAAGGESVGVLQLDDAGSAVVFSAVHE